VADWKTKSKPKNSSGEPAPPETLEPIIMSEKHLTELPWKTLAQKHGIKDGTLQKALAKLMAAKEDDYDGRLKILKEIDGCCDNLKKANKTNKEIVTYLTDIGKEADQSRIAIDLLKKGGAKKAAEDEAEEGEDEEAGLDLKGKLLSALRKVKMRKPVDPPVEALVCKAGSSFAVLMAKKVGASHKKELQDMLPNAGAPQFFKGTCEYGDADTYNFILERLPGGAKKGLTAFLKEHTATNYKVQVRSLAGETEADSEVPGQTADPVAAFKNRLTGMLDRIKEAVSSGSANGQNAKLKASEAGVFASKKDYTKAHQLLDEVETLLKKSPAPTGPKPTAAAALGAWQTARSSVISKLNGIAKEVAAAKHPKGDKALIQLKAVMAQLTAEPNTPQKVSELERYLAQDDVVGDICQLAEDIRTPLLAALAPLKP